jgi:hypothetical protein
MDTLRHTIRTAAETLATGRGAGGGYHYDSAIYTTAATTAAIALFGYGRQCYLEWHALGEGGIPRSPRGWLMNVAAHLVARRDHRAVPAPYEKPTTSTATKTEIITLSAAEEEKYGKYARTSFFAPGFALSGSGAGGGMGGRFAVREGRRPHVPTTVMPQRQTTEEASDATMERQAAFLRALVDANESLFTIKASALESPKFEALWLRSPTSSSPSETRKDGGNVDAAVDPSLVKWTARQARGEIAHVHPEGSTHVNLSLVDAAEVVRRGWGERHKMSGVAGILPWGYVLVYAPREKGVEGNGDWEVWREIVLAAARVMARCAGFEGEVVVPA